VSFLQRRGPTPTACRDSNVSPPNPATIRPRQSRSELMPGADHQADRLHGLAPQLSDVAGAASGTRLSGGEGVELLGMIFAVAWQSISLADIDHVVREVSLSFQLSSPRRPTMLSSRSSASRAYCGSREEDQYIEDQQAGHHHGPQPPRPEHPRSFPRKNGCHPPVARSVAIGARAARGCCPAFRSCAGPTVHRFIPPPTGERLGGTRLRANGARAGALGHIC